MHGGWGFGMAVSTYRGDYASIGQFGWDGRTDTTTYADPKKQLTGIVLTQVGMSTANSARVSTTSGPWSTRQLKTDTKHAPGNPALNTQRSAPWRPIGSKSCLWYFA
jgi:CubicO group peptidase (beta-lactamase class C family)